MNETIPEIIFEDEDILVLNKPSGMVVNISETSPENTLQSWVKDRYPESFTEADDSDFYRRNGLIHRLDKETSGIVLFAKNREAFDDLQRQFKARNVQKEYVGIVFGDVEEGVLEVNAPIQRNPKSRTKMAVVDGGKESVTRLEKIRSWETEEGSFTLIKAFPKTGRTHQIRVHVAALGHPIAGDSLYAGQRRSLSSRDKYGRLMLHAKRIEFKHPRTGETVTFEATTPEEMK